MNENKRSQIFQRFKQHNPNPQTELNYSNTFELLIAVVLSAQATDISVNKVTEKLFPVANTPETILALGVKGLKKYIRTIGLFNTKAEHIIKTCRLLIDEYSSQVPDSRKDLEHLPGIGRKTANVILNTAFGQPVIAVDTHVFRVSNRTSIARGENVRVIEEQLMRYVPDEYKQVAHHWLILHGRYTCIARKPKCNNCIIYDLCEFKYKEVLDRKTN